MIFSKVRLWLVCIAALLLAAGFGLSARTSHGAGDLTVYADGLAAGWEDWSWGSTVDLGHAPPVHAGTAAAQIVYTEGFGGFSLRTATPLNGADYSALEFWAFGAAGGTSLSLGIQTADDENPVTTFDVTAPALAWTKFTVPLDKLGSPAQIARINWQEAAGAAQPAYFLDDIRFVAATGGTPEFPDATADSSRVFEPGPSGVAVAPNGRVYVVVYRVSRVYSWATAAAMAAGGPPEMIFGATNLDPDNGGCTEGPSPSILCGPESLAVDAAGNLYVADTYNHRVLIFKNPDTDASPTAADAVIGQPDLNSNTENYDSTGGDGIVEGFCFVRGVAVDAANNLYVVDESNHRVLRFNTPLTADKLPDLVLGRADLDDTSPCPTYDSGQNAANRFNWPLGVAVDSDGNVFVTDMRNNRVQRFDTPLTNGMDASASYAGFDWPHDVAVDPNGNLYAADTQHGRVRVYAGGASGDATHDHEFPGLNYPMGMAFNPDGDFFLADCGAPAPGDPDGYPPCETNPRGVFIYDAPGAPPITPDPNAAIHLQINAAADRSPISPYIYGINEYGMAGDVAAYMDALGISVRRWGGNITTRYNWQTDVANHASDWYFINVKESNAANLPADSAVNRVIGRNRQAGAESLLVMPMSGFVSNGTANACSFSVKKYGAQTDTASQDGFPDCGDGVKPGGALLTGNNPLDTSIAIDANFVKSWIADLKARYGAADSGGIRFYNLDNEPDIWFETHRDIRPNGLKYDDLRALSDTYGAAIKAADPAAQTLGPVVNGWTYYWHSPFDGQREDWETPDDRNAHGGVPLVPWYLQQMADYEQQHGVRILDYLDLHYYPEGVALAEAGNAARQAQRLRSTRSLWDPTYVDESWIADAGPDDGIIRLIPRMHEWVDANYPGTKLAITEYNWGALDHINGALAQADVLGIFGREGLGLATLWEPPQLNQPAAFAFRIYRNYDGSGGQFGDTHVRATSDDQAKLAVYAAQRSDDRVLTLVIVNKHTAPLNGQVALSGFKPKTTARVYRYSAANLNAILRQPDQAVGAGGFTAAFPANSITLVEIAASDGPDVTPVGPVRIYVPMSAGGRR